VALYYPNYRFALRKEEKWLHISSVVLTGSNKTTATCKFPRKDAGSDALERVVCPDSVFFAGNPRGRVGCSSPEFRQSNPRHWRADEYFLPFSPFQGCSPRMRREVLLEPVNSVDRAGAGLLAAKGTDHDPVQGEQVLGACLPA